MEQYVIYPIFSLNFVINNVIFYLLIAALITILIGKGIMKGNIISNNWGILSESLFRTILKMIEEFVGPKFSIYLPLFYSIFNLVLFSNLLGLVPYTSTPTVEIVMTLSIAFTLLIGLLLIGFLTHKLYLLAIFSINTNSNRYSSYKGKALPPLPRQEDVDAIYSKPEIVQRERRGA